VHIALVAKSTESGIIVLSLYDEDLHLIESESFTDLYTLNFHLQTLAKKQSIKKGLLVIHDKDKNTVRLLLANDEHSFFISQSEVS
jgi:hypothetical protein